MKNILLVVDLQEGFTKKENTREIRNKVEKLLEKKIFDIVIRTKYVNYKGNVFEKTNGLEWFTDRRRNRNSK